MRIKKAVCAVGLSLGMSLTLPAWAQESSSGERLVDQIIQDIIHRTAEAARDEVRHQTGIDPFERGYGHRDDYYPAPSHINDGMRSELQRLDAEHDRKIAKLEEELQRTLNKAEREFRREAGKEDKPGKVREKREKLREKVDKAHNKFEEKVHKENERFDRKREKILSKGYE